MSDLTHVAFDLRDPDRSGIARVARSMAREFTRLARDRFEVTLCGPATVLERLGVAEWGPANVVDWPAGRLSLEAERTWGRVKRAAGPGTWYFPHWDAPFHAFPNRSVVTVHDLTGLRVPGATSLIRREISRLWIRQSARRATRIIVGTAFSRDEIGSEWPDLTERIRIVPHGVEPRFFGEPPPLSGNLARIANQGPFMLSVGNRKPHKNLVMGPEVLRRLPHLKWIVVGERFRGWENVPDLARKLGVTDRIHVVDPQPDSVLHGLYRAAGCLFFPSRHEGFGLPVLEALAAGTRVVAGRAGATVEVLGGHGAICPVDDADCFAAAVEKAVSAGAPPPPAGKSHAASFTWSRSATMLADIADEIA
jgi:glycosyltransferase involved in cell wall biosynthesis